MSNDTTREGHIKHLDNLLRITQSKGWIKECAALQAAIEALTPSPAQADTCVASITLPQAMALVDYFGGSNTEVLLYDFPEGRITDDDGSPCPAGLYAVCADCPEEGATYLGKHDPDAEVPAQAEGEAAWDAVYAVSDAAEYMDYDPDSRFGDAMRKVDAAIAARAKESRHDG